MDSKILELININKTFKSDLLRPNHQALSDVSCSFLKNHAVAVLGHNGAGKTTTLRTILGLLKPDSGQVLFEGRPMVHEDRRNIGYMPEMNKLPVELRSEELLYFHLNLYKPRLSRAEKRELVLEKLESVGLLKRHRKAKIHQLSKGLGRRLAWAMASIHDPSLIILDEPFTGMDPLGRRDLQDWVLKSVEASRSLIMTTHDITTAKRLCPHLLIFRQGKVVYEGSSDISEAEILSYFEETL